HRAFSQQPFSTCLANRFGLCSVPSIGRRMTTGAEMIHLGRQELDVWLGEPDDFVLAVLRDLYEHETDVERWLNTPHVEFGGRSAVDLLSAGHLTEVEAL